MTNNRTQNPMEEKISPLIEMALVLIVKMREYIEIYAKDVQVTDTQLYKDGIAKLEKAIDELAALFGLKGEMLIMSKQMEKLNQLYQANQQTSSSQTVPADADQQDNLNSDDQATQVQEQTATPQEASTQQEPSAPTTTAEEPTMDASIMPELQQTAEEVASNSAASQPVSDGDNNSQSTNPESPTTDEPQESTQASQQEESSGSSVPDIDELNKLLAQLEQQAKNQQGE